MAAPVRLVSTQDGTNVGLGGEARLCFLSLNGWHDGEFSSFDWCRRLRFEAAWDIVTCADRAKQCYFVPENPKYISPNDHVVPIPNKGQQTKRTSQGR